LLHTARRVENAGSCRGYEDHDKDVSEMAQRLVDLKQRASERRLAEGGFGAVSDEEAGNVVQFMLELEKMLNKEARGDSKAEATDPTRARTPRRRPW
jgi:hypothetical protein